MKTLATMILPISILAYAPAYAGSMDISTIQSRKTAPGPADKFTGKVDVTPMFPADHHTQSSGGHVAFAAGARSAWHTHPAGQTLIVTEGTGWVQEEGEAKREIHPGDVIWTPPGVKHWHGATDKTAVSHIAVTEVVDGKNVLWMEKVTDEQYLN
jgi:quercetin dioxygenase-like cupin family protein